MSRRWLPDRLVGVILLSLAACQPSHPTPSPDPDNGGLVLPPGFGAWVVADSTGRARHLAVRDNGDIYVKLSSTDEAQGGIVALRDEDHDGRADRKLRFGGEPEGSRTYGTAMTIHRDYLYYSSALVLYRQRLDDQHLVPQARREEVLIDDHPHGVHWHITKPVAFDDQGYMYVPFGAPSNACQTLAATPNGAPGGQGLDPCPELELHGGIWRFDADVVGLTQGDGVRMATGLRSIVGMDWHPADQHLYVMMHGRDNLYSLFPDRYDPWQSAMLPAEEFIRVQPGADYGWPYCYYDQMQQRKVLAPEYGGDGNVVGRCQGMALPEIGFPGHWAPNDLLFYRGNQFPERYRQGAFIAFHGSTNRAPYPQAGYFVAFVPFENGRSVGHWEVFADGFAGVDPIVNTSDAHHRPVGLAEGPDGSLYVVESKQGKVWRVIYQNDNSEPSPAANVVYGSHIRTPDPIKDHLQRDLAAGERLYNSFCGTCHQRNGQGAPGRFPPLAKTEWVTGSKDRLIRSVVHGLSGEIEVNGETYHGLMPAFDFLSDEDIATILTFIRTHFGNDASPISVKEVAASR